MGDPRRFQRLADFLVERFPPEKYPRVADVAGGGGYLSMQLVRHGYKPTVIDPRTTSLNRARRGGHGEHSFRRLYRCFTSGEAINYDLVVGLHPDGATEAIIDCVGFCPVVIVPCCNYWQGIESHQSQSADVVKLIKIHWRTRGIKWEEHRLPINGKNLALVAGISP